MEQQLTVRTNSVKINYCPLAQSVEQMTVNHWVRGSNPRGAVSFKIYQPIYAWEDLAWKNVIAAAANAVN